MTTEEFQKAIQAAYRQGYGDGVKLIMETKYVVIVENKSAPRKIHKSLESAQAEAMRLAKIEVGHVVTVAQVLNRMVGKVTVVDFDGARER